MDGYSLWRPAAALNFRRAGSQRPARLYLLQQWFQMLDCVLMQVERSGVERQTRGHALGFHAVAQHVERGP